MQRFCGSPSMQMRVAAGRGSGPELLRGISAPCTAVVHGAGMSTTVLMAVAWAATTAIFVPFPKDSPQGYHFLCPLQFYCWSGNCSSHTRKASSWDLGPVGDQSSCGYLYLGMVSLLTPFLPFWQALQSPI